MFDVILTILQKTLGHAQVNGTYVPGTFVWATDDPSVVTLIPSADGLTCEVLSAALGTCSVTCTVEASPGMPIASRAYSFQVIDAAATALTLTFDPPVPK
jgi:hypothetical protein